MKEYRKQIDAILEAGDAELGERKIEKVLDSALALNDGFAIGIEKIGIIEEILQALDCEFNGFEAESAVAREKRIKALNLVLEYLSAEIARLEVKVTGFKNEKSKPKVMPFVKVVKLQEKIDLVEALDERVEEICEEEFGKACAVEQDYLEEAQKFLRETENLNERVLNLNEEVVLRLDLYLQMQSKVNYYYRKALDEQRTTLANTEANLETVTQDLQNNVKDLQSVLNQTQTPTLIKYIHLMILSLILGFLFSGYIIKKVSFFHSPRIYF